MLDLIFFGFEHDQLANWFGDLGGRERIENFFHKWLPEGNFFESTTYGTSPNPDLSYLAFDTAFTQCLFSPGQRSVTSNTRLNTLAMAEIFRYLYLNPEMLSAFGLTENDDIALFVNGIAAFRSLAFGDTQWNGLNVDPAIYVQESVNLKKIEEESDGNWRIRSFSSSGQNGLNSEIVHTVYAYLPGPIFVINPFDRFERRTGHEFIISARISAEASFEEVDMRLYRAISQVVNSLITDKI